MTTTSQFITTTALIRRAKQRLFQLVGLKKMKDDLRYKVKCLKPQGSSRGNALLSFINEPFYLTREQAGLYGNHTHFWASAEIANILLDLGYTVDVIRWNNNRFTPEKEYSLFIDARLNMERIGPKLPKECIKIFYIETAHWLFHMNAQYLRLLDLQQRRGVTLNLEKTVASNWAIENCDYATSIGNEFTINTFSYARKPVYRLPIILCDQYPWPADKDFESTRNHFLWFGSGGLVHKGLDLVLEAFAGMPEFHLTVCGPVKGEPQFERAYWKELYESPNIHTLGWIDTNSSQFVELCNSCRGTIYASCSEGGGGSVITCMHAGLIPVVSYESSVDLDDFGILLRENTIGGIQAAIRLASTLPTEQAKAMSRLAWESARAHYTRERFSEEYRKFLTSAIEKRARPETWSPQLSPDRVAHS